MFMIQIVVQCSVRCVNDRRARRRQIKDRLVPGPSTAADEIQSPLRSRGYNSLVFSIPGMWSVIAKDGRVGDHTGPGPPTIIKIM